MIAKLILFIYLLGDVLLQLIFIFKKKTEPIGYGKEKKHLRSL
jgi:hypothetical protein